MNPGTLLIRADASAAIGTGHVMRSLALAQAWQDSGGQTIFAMAQSTDSINRRIASELCEIVQLFVTTGSPEDSYATASLAKKQEARWTCIDGYAFGETYLESLKAAGLRLLFIDDRRNGPCAADLVLNQNLYATEQQYAGVGAHCRLLLGPKYALIRREFNRWRGWKRTISPACRRLLVTMGGSDPENITGRIIEALQSPILATLEATVLVGGSNPNLAALRSSAAGSESRIQLRENVLQMGELMAEADLAISAAGSTSWELCLLGTPMLLIDIADNQTAVAEALHQHGCAIHAGDRFVSSSVLANAIALLANSEERRRLLSECSQQIVDGKGAQRVVDALQGNPAITLRPARLGDDKLLWQWANDAEVRAASFSREPIPWGAHVRWLAERVVDKNTLFLIAEGSDKNPIGQVRFDIAGTGAELNISLCNEKRRSGLAVPTIHAAVLELFSQRDCDRVDAYVKPENVASVRVFERAGFERIGMTAVKGNPAIHFRRRRG